MEIKFRCKASEEGQKVVREIVEKILDANDRSLIEEKMDAIVSVKYSTKHPNGVVVLRFQVKDVGFGRLTIPPLSEDNASSDSIGPAHHIVWTRKLDKFFRVVESKGKDTIIELI